MHSLNNLHLSSSCSSVAALLQLLQLCCSIGTPAVGGDTLNNILRSPASKEADTGGGRNGYHGRNLLRTYTRECRRVFLQTLLVTVVMQALYRPFFFSLGLAHALSALTLSVSNIYRHFSLSLSLDASAYVRTYDTHTSIPDLRY